MKNTISITLFIFISLSCFAQSAFDKALSEVSTDLADKLTLKGKKKTVVLYITDINKAPTVGGKYLADIISSNIVNNAGNFMVFDRDNLNGIAEINKLISEGYLDESKTQEIGRILSVETIIVGSYTVLSKTIKLSTKALDVTTAFVIASSLKDLPLDGDATALFGTNESSPATNNQNINNSNRGYNTPLNSNEQYNNPGTVSKECETKNTGDYCFTNSTNVKLNLGVGIQNISLDPGQTQCLYNILSREWNYAYYEHNNYSPSKKQGKGQILIEKCKSKTQIIR